jgi:type II secretory pathway component PulC
LIIVSLAIIVKIFTFSDKILSRPSQPPLDQNKSIQQNQPKPSLGEYAIVMERNIFSVRTPQPKLSEVSMPLQNIPMTNSIANMRLVGTILSEDDHASIAIINDATTNKEALYHEGDTIGGIRILKIMRRQVLLKNSQEEMVLTMKSNEDNHKSQGKIKRRSARSTQPSRTQ